VNAPAEEVGGMLIWEDGLVVLAGEEFVEWYQTHVFRVVDTIPIAPFRPLLRAIRNSAASCNVQ
jgi:hypothetical protein